MRIAVVSAPPKRRSPPDYVRALARGMESMGHKVDIIDAWTDDGMRLPGYEYVAIVTEPASFFSAAIPAIIPKMLSVSSGIGGKKSAAFVKKGSLRSNRILTNIMKAMEKEGMMVNWSEILFSVPHAEAIGKRVG